EAAHARRRGFAWSVERVAGRERLDREKGVAAGPLVKPRQGGGGGWSTRERCELVERQRAERDHLADPGARRNARLRADAMARLDVAKRADDEEGSRWALARHEAQHLERAFVGPVQVVERDHEGRALRERREQPRPGI